MKCFHCGGTVSSAAQICPRCGRPLTVGSSACQEGERFYNLLCQQYQERMITYPYFVQEVSKIRVLDSYGQTWTLDVTAGRWTRVDGGGKPATNQASRSKLKRSNRSSKIPKWAWGLGAGATGLILVSGVVVLLLLGYQQVQASPKIYSVSAAIQGSGQRYNFSDDQNRILLESGYPDSFSLLFYSETAEDGSIESRRHETWTYYALGKEYIFLNGALTHEQSLDYSPENVRKAPYQPEIFISGMTVDQIVAASGLKEYMEVPLEKELLPGGRLYYGDQLTFGMKAGKLLYLETLAIEEDQP